MSGFSTAFEMFLTVGIGASLIGKLTTGTAAAPLTNQKIPESTGSLKPWLDLETQYPPTYLNELVQDKLTRAQRRNVQTFINIYDNNLKYSDFTGTLKDLLGSPVLKGNGNAYNHLQEMEQSYVALKKVHRALENSLKNPNLERDVYEYLMKNYEAVSMNLRKIENLFSFKN